MSMVSLLLLLVLTGRISGRRHRRLVFEWRVSFDLDAARATLALDYARHGLSLLLLLMLLLLLLMKMHVLLLSFLVEIDIVIVVIVVVVVVVVLLLLIVALVVDVLVVASRSICGQYVHIEQVVDREYANVVTHECSVAESLRLVVARLVPFDQASV